MLRLTQRVVRDELGEANSLLWLNFAINDFVRKLTEVNQAWHAIVPEIVQQKRLSPQVLIQIELLKFDVVDDEHVEVARLLIIEHLRRLHAERVAKVEQKQVVHVLLPGVESLLFGPLRIMMVMPAVTMALRSAATVTRRRRIGTARDNYHLGDLIEAQLRRLKSSVAVAFSIVDDVDARLHVKYSRHAHQLIFDDVNVMYNIFDTVQAQEQVTHVHILRQPVLLKLTRHDAALVRDVKQSFIELLEGVTNEVHEVGTVYDLALTTLQQLHVDVAKHFEEERLLYLNRIADGAAQSVQHEFEFTLLHVGLFVVAEQFENHCKNT